MAAAQAAVALALLRAERVVAVGQPHAAAEVEAPGARLEGVEVPGAPPEAEPLGERLEPVEAEVTDALPRPEAAVEVADAPREAEVEPLGVRLEAVEAEVTDALPRPEAAIEVTDAVREAEVEPLGARLEAVEMEVADALPRSALGMELLGERPMATLVVGPAVVVHAVLTIVPAASQELRHLAWAVRMALLSGPAQTVGLAVVPMGSAEGWGQLLETGSEP